MTTDQFDDRFENNERLKRPKTALKADYGRSARSAIKLFCLTCMGGCLEDVKKCQAFACNLWQYRPGAKKDMTERNKHIVPKEQLEELVKKAATKARRKQARKMLEDRKKNETN